MLILVRLAFIKRYQIIYTSLEAVKVKSMCIALIISIEKETHQGPRRLGALWTVPISSDVRCMLGPSTQGQETKLLSPWKVYQHDASSKNH